MPVLTEINSCSWALGMKDKLGYTTIVLSISFQLNFKDVHFASAESPWFIHIIDIIMCTVPTHDHVHMDNMPITAARLLFSLRMYFISAITVMWQHKIMTSHFADSERSIKDAFIFFSSCVIRFSTMPFAPCVAVWAVPSPHLRGTLRQDVLISQCSL